MIIKGNTGYVKKSNPFSRKYVGNLETMKRILSASSLSTLVKKMLGCLTQEARGGHSEEIYIKITAEKMTYRCKDQ